MTHRWSIVDINKKTRNVMKDIGRYKMGASGRKRDLDLLF